MANKRKAKHRKPAPEPPHVDVAAFIASQGGPKRVDPIKLRERAKGIWPEDESIDEFLDWFRKLREQRTP